MEWNTIILMIVIVNFLVTLWLWKGLSVINMTTNCIHNGLHHLLEEGEQRDIQRNEFIEELKEKANHLEVVKWDHDDSNASE